MFLKRSLRNKTNFNEFQTQTFIVSIDKKPMETIGLEPILFVSKTKYLPINNMLRNAAFCVPDHLTEHWRPNPTRCGIPVHALSTAGFEHKGSSLF